MESHVNGPTTLGELRHSLLAVVVGNPLFTPEEQLQTNHAAHESESVPELAQLLRQLRLEDATRGALARHRAARAVAQVGVCTDEATQGAELVRMLNCQAIDKASRRAYASIFSMSSMSRTRSRLAILGNGYLEALENLGSIPAHPGYEALYDN
ncbi:MAG: hypothetical protein ACRYFV_20565 [Janthinobacterium lividum]